MVVTNPLTLAEQKFAPGRANLHPRYTVVLVEGVLFHIGAVENALSKHDMNPARTFVMEGGAHVEGRHR